LENKIIDDLGELLCRGVARYCGLELKEDGSPNNLLLAASIWAPCGSQDAIKRRLLLTHNIEPDLSCSNRGGKNQEVMHLPTKKHMQIS
jgi:hypothetical protein